MAVSKRLRFEILRRDGHTCRYCGRSAPEVTLTVDHVVPETLGGTDDPSNLVAACADCNSGKSSVPADAPLVDDVANDALRWVRAMEQAALEMGQNDAAHIAAYEAVQDGWHSGNLPSDWQESIDAFLAAGLPLDIIARMVRVAQNKRGAMGHRWAYFCGCCWNRIRELQGRASEIARSPLTPAVTETLRLTTRWTSEELVEMLTNSEDFASRWLSPKSIASAYCTHLDWGEGDCGDPVCVAIRSESLSWMSDSNLLKSMRADAVMDMADDLNDSVDA